MNAAKKSQSDRETAHAAAGGPLMIDVDLIDEDPHQPRSQDNPGFRPESIAELAASYGPKGPKTPLSLREHPEVKGRYIINHGHRRYRAGKLKGLAKMPAFIDNEYENADQVVENLQRESMTPREMADYIGRELANGKKKGEIAERIGKSASFVSQHVTLLDLPEPIAIAFNGGRVNDVTLVNELVTAYKAYPAEVESWLSSPSQEVTRATVRLLRDYLVEKRGERRAPGDPADQAVGQAREGAASFEEGKRRPAAEKRKPALVQVEHDGRSAYLVLDRRPTAVEYAWLEYDDGHHGEAALAEVRLIAIVESRRA